MSLNRHYQLLVLCCGLAGLAGGCRDTGPKNQEFFVQHDACAVTTALDRQIASGARYDGMLREQHFNDRQVNTLGREKLDRILAAPGLVNVYLPGPADEATVAARRESILAYARDRGRAEGEVVVNAGLNPATLHAAAPLTARLSKTEAGRSDQAAPETDAAGDPRTTGNNSLPSIGSTPGGGG